LDIDIDRAEAQLNRLVEDRAASAKAENERAAMWAESVRRYNLGRAREKRAAWADHHRRMIDVHEGLAQEHRYTLSKLIDGKV
jgi:hypothetical protein